MRLSDVQISGLDVWRDSEFHSLGLLTHRQAQMLVMLYDETYLGKLLENPAIRAVITTPELAERLPDGLGVGVCSDPMAVFYQVHQYLLEHTDFYGRPFSTEVDSTARISDRAYIAPSRVRIGPRVVVEPGAVIQEGCILDEGVVIRSGTVVGGEGFEPKWVGGRHFIVPHAGGVHLSRGVQVLSHSHIARNLYGGYTEVGEETLIDVLVHVSHNVRIGAGCEIAAGAIIAGSTTVGNNVWIGMSATLSSELTIGDGAFIAMGAAVAMNVPSGGKVMGNPARLMKPPATT